MTTNHHPAFQLRQAQTERATYGPVMAARIGRLNQGEAHDALALIAARHPEAVTVALDYLDQEQHTAHAGPERPEGQPGTIDNGYPAVRDPDGTVWVWADDRTGAGGGVWTRALPISPIDTFEPGEEWQEDCPHHRADAPWMTCDFEADCIALQREDGE